MNSGRHELTICPDCHKLSEFCSCQNEYCAQEACLATKQQAPETILEEAARLTSTDRQQSYGHPLDDYSRTAGMFNAAFSHKLRELFTAEEIMMVMVLVKLSRQLHKDKRDNIVDAAGYLRTMEMAGEERQRRGVPPQ